VHVHEEYNGGDDLDSERYSELSGVGEVLTSVTDPTFSVSQLCEAEPVTYQLAAKKPQLIINWVQPDSSPRAWGGEISA
jgi:hypothetical protein